MTEFNTTTLLVEKLSDYSQLENNYRLVRNELPFDVYQSLGYETAMIKLHKQLKEQLDTPYLIFNNDFLDEKQKRVIYALYNSGTDKNDIIPLEIDFIESIHNPLPWRWINFSDLDLHLLIKLLLAAFANSFPYFAGQGGYFIHVKEERPGWDLCMEIELSGGLNNYDEYDQEKQIQEMEISGHSRYFKIGEDYREGEVFYERYLEKGIVFFRQLTPAQARNYTGKLACLYSNNANRPHIDYHRQNNTEVQPCRGLYLHSFLQKFSKWLNKNGVECRHKTRNWIKYDIEDKSRGLEYPHLDIIYLHDRRHKKESIEFSAYREALSNNYPDVNWVILDNLDDITDDPVIVIQDADQEAYNRDQPLYVRDDPYQYIKDTYPEIPTQFVNVNSNKVLQDLDESSYLDYPMIQIERKNEWDIKFRNSIYQLYLKNVVLNNLSVSEYLPVDGLINDLINYIYIKKISKGKCAFMWIAEDRLEFSPLLTQKDRELLDSVCTDFGFTYTWQEICERLKDKTYKEEWQLGAYDLILLPGKVVMINELNETVLYDYPVCQNG